MRGNSTCPSGDFCELQYISRDGGQRWQRIELPTGTSLSVVGFVGPSASTSLSRSMFLAQGTHLFAALRSDNGAFSGYRLMVSADSGVTWAYADDAIVANKQSIIEGVASRTGSTLFVLTIGASIPFQNATRVTRLLWRSDDQGKHWAMVTAFPDVKGSRSRNGTASTHLAAAALGQDDRPLVYYVDETETAEQQAQPLNMSTLAPDHIFASRDGGNTWTPAPISGIPGNHQVVAANVGQLADGSMVAQVSRLTTNQANQNPVTFIQSDTAYYVWKPGDTGWRQLTSAAPGQFFLQQWLTPARPDSPETIWTLMRQDNIWTLQRCALG
jgi:BNR repeat-like domain